MAQNMAQLTDMWMVDPTMFDPTQASNQFSNYNNAALPWPPTYNTGAAGGPVNAATGQPIQSFQQWQQQNPGGMSINSTPAAPAAAAPQSAANWNPAMGPQALANMSGKPAQISAGGMIPTGQNTGLDHPQYIPSTYAYPQMQPQQQAPQAAPQPSGPPNNWQAAINALANPGKVTTQGATTPLVQGYQPSGGVNQAFLNQPGIGAGMNQNFLNALRSIQARPQG